MDNEIYSPTYTGPSLPSCLLCYLCGELFRRPRILPCGHTFCSECLAKLKDEIVHCGHAPSTTLSSSSDQQYATGNPRNPMSPERNALTASKVSPNNDTGSGVHFPNGRALDCQDKEDGSAVDCVASFKPNTSEPYSISSSTDAVVLRNSSHNMNHTDRKLLTRSDTYTVKREVSVDRTPSRLSCPSVAEGGAQKPCPQCGHLTPPRGNSPVKRSSSVKGKTTKRQGQSSTGPRWDNSPQRKSASALSPPACSFDQKHGKEMELFVCPMPDCNYSMRVMNLSRWSPRNKAIADVVAAWKRLHAESMDGSTQTEISNNQSLLVTLPRTLVNYKAVRPISTSRKRHSSMGDFGLEPLDISVDGLQRGYLPRGHFTWRSYATMVGMNILQQLVNF